VTAITWSPARYPPIVIDFLYFTCAIVKLVLVPYERISLTFSHANDWLKPQIRYVMITSTHFIQITKQKYWYLAVPSEFSAMYHVWCIKFFLFRGITHGIIRRFINVLLERLQLTPEIELSEYSSSKKKTTRLHFRVEYSRVAYSSTRGSSIYDAAAVCSRVRLSRFGSHAFASAGFNSPKFAAPWIFARRLPCRELIPGSRDPEIPGSRAFFQSRNPGIEFTQSRDFRD